MAADDMNGRLIVVGAGPGDRGLVTLRGIDALARCSVVVHDQRVGALAREFAPDDAEFFDMAQLGSEEDRADFIATRAKAGAVVGRLVVGDPFLVGRASPEVLRCHGMGVAVEVVPGLSPAACGPTYAGIPLVQAGLCGSVAIHTGPYELRPAAPSPAPPDSGSGPAAVAAPAPARKSPGVTVKRRSKSPPPAPAPPPPPPEPEYWSPDDTLLPDGSRPLVAPAPAPAAAPAAPAPPQPAPPPEEQPAPAANEPLARWRAIALGAETLVFLEATRALGVVRAGLLMGGRRAAEPVAAIVEPGTLRQTTHITTLEHLERDLVPLNLKEPAVLVVGETVALRSELDFFEARPLFGLRMVLLEEGPGRVARQLALEHQGAQTELVSLLGTAALPGVGELLESMDDDLRAATHLVFADVTAARVFLGNLLIEHGTGPDLRILPEGCQIIVMDEETRALLVSRGLRSTMLRDGGGYSSSRLLDYLEMGMKNQHVLLVGQASTHSRLATEIRVRGGTFVDIPVYDAAPSPAVIEVLARRLRNLEIDVMICTSALSLEALHHAWGAEQTPRMLEDCMVVTQGLAPTRAAQRLGIPQFITAGPDPTDLAKALAAWRHG